VEEARASTTDLGHWRHRSSGDDVVDGMQKWNGIVRVVAENTITAELTPSNHEGPGVYADFDLTLLTPSEQHSLAPGSVVYVTVRTVRNRSRQATRTSAIKVARLGRWTATDVDAAKVRAKARVADMLKNSE